MGLESEIKNAVIELQEQKDYSKTPESIEPVVETENIEKVINTELDEEFKENEFRNEAYEVSSYDSEVYESSFDSSKYYDSLKDKEKEYTIESYEHKLLQDAQKVAEETRVSVETGRSSSNLDLYVDSDKREAKKNMKAQSLVVWQLMYDGKLVFN